MMANRRREKTDLVLIYTLPWRCMQPLSPFYPSTQTQQRKLLRSSALLRFVTSPRLREECTDLVMGSRHVRYRELTRP